MSRKPLAINHNHSRLLYFHKKSLRLFSIQNFIRPQRTNKAKNQVNWILRGNGIEACKIAIYALKMWNITNCPIILFQSHYCDMRLVIIVPLPQWWDNTAIKNLKNKKLPVKIETKINENSQYHCWKLFWILKNEQHISINLKKLPLSLLRIQYKVWEIRLKVANLKTPSIL